jgi:uncharacterized repeat protein (TIGR02543 family)
MLQALPCKSRSIFNLNQKPSNMKILRPFLLALASAIRAAGAASAQAGASGTTGSCAWTLTGAADNLTLNISGQGAMENYSYGTAPWYSYRSNIKTLSIAQGVTAIGEAAFRSCSGLTAVTIPEGVTAIGVKAFSDCSGLTAVTIPASVTAIDDYVFIFCRGLTAINVDTDNTAYASENGVVFNKSKTALICHPAGKSGSYTIPAGVTAIGEAAFFYCSGLTAVTIPEGVTAIGEAAFYYCSGLTAVTIPEGVTAIGVKAFSDCSGLTAVTIPASVTAIGNHAFWNCCGLTAINVNADNTAYASENGILFNKSQTTLIQCPASKSGSATIPASLTAIDDNVFISCSGLTAINVDAANTAYASENGVVFNKNKTALICHPAGKSGSYTIPAGVTAIGNCAFWNCYGLTAVIIPASVTAIGESAFSYCSGLTAVTIPASVAAIEYQTFWDCCSLTAVTIPVSVTAIGESAFGYCSGLTAVTIPASVAAIGYYAFEGCSGLTAVTNLSLTPQSIDSNVFDNVPKTTCKLRVPASAVKAYKNADVWKDFKTILAVTLATLTFNAAEGTVSPADMSVPQGSPVGAVGELPTPVRSGYTFGGWFTEQNGGGTEYTAATTATGSLTLYAKWQTAATGVKNLQLASVSL